MSVTVEPTAAEGYVGEDRAILDRVVDTILPLDKDDNGKQSLMSQPPAGKGSGTRSGDMVFALSFGCEPGLAVQYLLYRLIERIRDKEKADSRFRVAEFPVPVPLPLAEPYQHPVEIPQQLRKGIAWVERRVGKKGESGDTELVREDVLHNVIHFFPEKLLLIAFSHPSREIRYEPVSNDGDDEIPRIQRLHEYVHRHEHRRPQVLFVASDRHHAEMIAEKWT